MPDKFAECVCSLLKYGVKVIGGCCGTNPDYIAKIKSEVADREYQPQTKSVDTTVCSSTTVVEINGPRIIGERINPTGKKKLQAQLREGKLDLVRQMAMEQETNGAGILDINMGMNGIDEKEMMKPVIYEVSSTVDCPLCIDSSYVEVIEEALKIYPGRALINSISLETEKMEKLLPLAAKYGAMFILLPLSDAGLPKDVEERVEARLDGLKA